jgi:DNA-binding transcriptional LysR family regulator
VRSLDTPRPSDTAWWGVAAHPENLPGPHIKRQTIVATALRCEAELAGLSDLRDRPAGTIRISANEHAASIVLWPALERFLPNYPDIKAEIVVDNGLIDIVAERFNAGVRTGGIIAKDMIDVPIGPDIRMVVVGSPSYLATMPPPKIPQDLTSQRCVNLRLPTHGGIYAWEFEKGGREMRVRVDGQLVLNSISLMLNAALAGFGLAYVAEDQVQPYLQSGRPVQVLGVGIKRDFLAFTGFQRTAVLADKSANSPTPAKTEQRERPC